MGFEQLPERTPLAGDVSVSWSRDGGTLVVEGDNSDNTVYLSQVGTNSLVISGSNTKINGSGSVTVTIPRDGIVISTNDGKDNVQIGLGQAFSKVKFDINLGPQIDQLAISALTCSQLNINTGENNGKSADFISLSKVNAAELNYNNPGASWGTLAIDNTKISGNCSIIGGDGRDYITISTSSFGSLGMSLGNQPANSQAEVKLSSVIVKNDTNIQFGSGKGYALLANSQTKNLSVKMGNSDGDTLILQNYFAELATVDGGGGAADTLSLWGLNRIGKLQAANFEKR